MVADKITLLLIAVVAMFIARRPDSSVFTIVSFAWAGFGAVLGPVVILALFWRRSNWQGALAGMILRRFHGIDLEIRNQQTRRRLGNLRTPPRIPGGHRSKHHRQPHHEGTIERDHRRI